MIRRSTTFFLSIFLLLNLFGQARSGGLVSEHVQALMSKGVAFEPVELFSPVAASPVADALWLRACYRASVVRLEPTLAARLLERQPPYISLSVPGANGAVVMDLEKVEITTSDFRVVQASTGLPVRSAVSVHYQGMVRGEAGSIAAISVFPEEVMGILGGQDGQQVIGRFDNDRDGLHVFYREDDLREKRGSECDVREVPGDAVRPEPAPEGERTTRCVRLYWEVDNDIFLNKGSMVNTTNYVTGLFNQSSILYANDGIDVTLSEVYVWDVTSPYTGSSSNSLLDQFGDYRTSFNGDLAHLLAFRGGGGIAWLNTLCNGTRYRMAFSGISSSYNSVPTYSWSVEVVTHETGHNLGSPHTHACAWNGNATAIDGCGPAAGYVEGSCSAAPVPTTAVGGTVMSYCHLVSAGIKFVNGFGPQPTALIVGRVNASSCLLACGTSCDSPTGLTASSITATSATLGWASAGATTYTLQWRTSPSGAWTTVTGLTNNSYLLNGLAQEIAYDFRVLSVCGSEVSAYSAVFTFTTVAPCPDALEPNNTLATAGPIAVPGSINALIAYAGDQDYYSFTVAAASNITMNLSGLAGDYDLQLLNAAGTVVAYSQNGGTTTEYINYAAAAAGTYYARVYGYAGVFSASQCYSLNIYVQINACPVPVELQAQAITYNSALLVWSSSPQVSLFNLRYRRSADPSWTVVNSISGNSHPLTGLDPSTNYIFQLGSVCGSGGNQQYSDTAEFITLEAPCEVAPPILLQIKALLQGAYHTSEGLMVDSLRVAGLLPTTEPYTAMGFAVEGAVTVDPALFTVTGPNAIVDWVLVELRNAANPSVVEETRVALLQRDGDITALDGTSALGLCSNAGDYRVTVRHRNHLGCMSGTYSLSSTSTAINFTLAGTSTYGTNARKAEGGVMLLWSGNVSGNNMVSYTGAANDRDPILQAFGSSPITGAISGYSAADVNMDGKVRYTGTNNDRDPILSNIGGSVPSQVVNEQLP